MNFRGKRTDDPDLNITPLIDVVFLLLIFFMVTTTFDRDSEISITLPEASREQVETDKQTIDIDIDKRGQVYVNARALVNTQSDTIRDALEEAATNVDAGAGEQGPVVVINADAETSHQSVISVMDAARQVGLRQITFATRIESQDE